MQSPPRPARPDSPAASLLRPQSAMRREGGTDIAEDEAAPRVTAPPVAVLSYASLPSDLERMRLIRDANTAVTLALVAMPRMRVGSSRSSPCRTATPPDLPLIRPAS